MNVMIAIIAVELGFIIYSLLWIIGFFTEFMKMNTIEFGEEDDDDQDIK